MAAYRYRSVLFCYLCEHLCMHQATCGFPSSMTLILIFHFCTMTGPARRAYPHGSSVYSTSHQTRPVTNILTYGRCDVAVRYRRLCTRRGASWSSCNSCKGCHQKLLEQGNPQALLLFRHWLVLLTNVELWWCKG